MHGCCTVSAVPGKLRCAGTEVCNMRLQLLAKISQVLQERQAEKFVRYSSISADGAAQTRLMSAQT